MKSSVSQWMFFVGSLLLLMGIYGFARIAHVSLKKVPYPSAGVFPPTILTSPDAVYLGQRESDCNPYPMLYYDQDGKTSRQPTEEEKANQEDITKRCINGFNEDRSKQTQRDKTQAAFLVFVGAGLILIQQRILK